MRTIYYWNEIDMNEKKILKIKHITKIIQYWWHKKYINEIKNNIT